MFFKHRSVWFALLLLLAAALACTLPSTAPAQPDGNDSVATSVAATVQAANGNAPTAAVPAAASQAPPPASNPPTAVVAAPGNSSPAGQSGQGSAPTQPPTSAPSGNNNPGTTAISFTDVRVNPSDTVYYGACGNGETTSIHIEAGIDPLDQIQNVVVWVDLSDSTGVVYSQPISMWLLGIGDYAADIDVDQIASAALNDPDGSLSFYIAILDKSGNTTYGNTYYLQVLSCGGVLGQPPTDGSPDIIYFTANPTSVTAGDTVQLSWEVWNACQVFVDGSAVNAVDSWAYPIPADAGDTVYTFTLVAFGSSCDSSTQRTEQVSVNISAAGSGSSGNSGGSAVVRFVNNSSHPVVELQIDGTEVILAESQTLLSGGGTLDVTVSDGGHTFAAGAGYWSGGVKNAIYPLPGGSFNAQDGTVVIYDPTITQIMTYYGNGGYFGGPYWEGTTPRCAAFQFYADGSFDFYIDGAWNDSGTYSLVQRYPSSYAVEFNVTNASGTESLNGTYYYSGAQAGTMYLNNGPAGWEQIEYIYNGGC